MSKKIIIIGPAHPYRGGIASFNHRLAQELMDQGNDVETLTFTLQYPDILFPGRSQFSSDPEPNFLNIKRTINSINPISWIQTAKIITKANPDILICRFWIPFVGMSMGSILRLIRNNGCQKIAIVDNIIPHESRIGDRTLSRYFANACDEFMVMSKQVEQDLRPFAKGKRIKYCLHPVYDNYGESISRKSAHKNLLLNSSLRYLLFFGLIREYKGLDLLLRALDPELCSDLNLRILIVGEFYEPKQKYIDILNEREINDFVTIVDQFIPDDEIKNYFCAADLIVQPYKTATQSGISQIAYQFNKPMLVTNVGGLPEIVENEKSGLVVDPDPVSIRSAIERFFKMDLGSKFIDGIAKKKEEFSWKRFVEILLSEPKKIK